ncbi:DUF2752 domain-containing protein [Streptomyces polyrhachis]|uniref:DUF2752 domain-containing protein n=1 Tax=Streptomyces polyrhachis TaxID=1282885 RepID=A0ABW2GFE7_9ACTN
MSSGAEYSGAESSAPARRRPVLPPSVAPLAVLALGAAGAVYLWHTNPHESGHWLPRCPFNWATGLLCPACGVTRLCYDLLHGDVAAAYADNALMLLAGVPFVLWAYGRWLIAALRGRRWRLTLSPRASAAVLGVAVVWTVLRNTVW